MDTEGSNVCTHFYMTYIRCFSTCICMSRDFYACSQMYRVPRYRYPQFYNYVCVPVHGYGSTTLVHHIYFSFCFRCCCRCPSCLLCFFSIVCMLVCVHLFSNALVDTPCCNIEPCGSLCIVEIYVCWVVVCCTTNNRWEKEMLLLWL